MEQKRAARKCAHIIFLLFSLSQGVKYHHHLRAGCYSLLYISGGGGVGGMKTRKHSLAAAAPESHCPREEQRKLMKHCGDKAAQQTPCP